MQNRSPRAVFCQCDPRAFGFARAQLAAQACNLVSLDHRRPVAPTGVLWKQGRPKRLNGQSRPPSFVRPRFPTKARLFLLSAKPSISKLKDLAKGSRTHEARIKSTSDAERRGFRVGLPAAATWLSPPFIGRAILATRQHRRPNLDCARPNFGRLVWAKRSSDTRV